MSTSPSSVKFILNFVFFRWWQGAQGQIGSWSISRQLLFFAPFAGLGLAGRLWAESGYRNFDFTSYLIVSDATLAGENPYETNRYNYGPVWFLILAGLRLGAQDADSFRLALAVFLAVVDLLIAAVLLRKGYALGAALFMVVPVGIAISGQHQQFDNFAILLALAGALLVRNSHDPRLHRSDWLAIGLLSASLTTKHIFVLLPLWFAYQQRSWAKKALYALIPGAAFALSLAPFLYLNAQAVLDNVIFYDSFNNSPALRNLLPGLVATQILDRGLGVVAFLLVVGFLGIFFTRIKGIQLVMVYAVTLVLFSSAIADQYLAIPLVAVTSFLNIGYAIWLVWTSIYFLGNTETISLPVLSSIRPYVFNTPDQAYQDLFAPLLLGWVLMLMWMFRDSIVGWVSSARTRSTL